MIPSLYRQLREGFGRTDHITYPLNYLLFTIMIIGINDSINRYIIFIMLLFTHTQPCTSIIFALFNAFGFSFDTAEIVFIVFPTCVYPTTGFRRSWYMTMYILEPNANGIYKGVSTKRCLKYISKQLVRESVAQPSLTAVRLHI